MKKLISIVLTAAIAGSMLVGCGSSQKTAPAPSESTKEETESSSEPAKDVKLTFMTNVVGEQATAIEEAINQFTEETGYEVEFSAPGKSYEELMKTKMSSNEMPDLFTTHGWSVARYSEYLMPVNDQPFAQDISEQIRPVIVDDNGNMYVLPIDRDTAGMIYNEAVLADSEVNVDDLKTWADFESACEKIKAKGYSPLHIGGKDNWTIGQFFDWVAPSFYITNEADNQRDALKAGTFDVPTWEKVAGLMDKWAKAGYFNEDVLTADYNADMEALAKGEVAFEFYGNSSIIDAKKINPDAKLGMMPIPSNSADDEPTLIAGERVAIGVWKDSPNKDAAVELLNFFAKPEITGAIATATGNPAGLNGVASDIGEIKEYYDKYSDVKTFPYFDREYLPSGMWDVMCETGANILAGQPNAVTDAAKVMEQNFNDKFSQ